MTFGFILLVLLPIAAIGYIVWDYRRKAAQRSQVSEGRLSELMGAVKEVQPQTQEPRPAERAAPTVFAAPPAAASVPRAETVPDGVLYARRERVLSSPQTLLYLLLKTGIPDHAVFARVTLASIVEVGPGLTGALREEQARRLAALTVDFLVADKDMRPLAVVELSTSDQGSVAQSERSSVRTRLAAAGVRYVELDARSLPRKDAIRAAVLGDAQAAGAVAAPVGAAR